MDKITFDNIRDCSMYSEVCPFSEKLAEVKNTLTGLWGYINTKGEEVIPCKYKLTSRFVNGGAYVYDSVLGKGYSIDHEGKILENHNQKLRLESSIKMERVYTSKDTYGYVYTRNGERIGDGTIYSSGQEFPFGEKATICYADGEKYILLSCGFRTPIKKATHSNFSNGRIVISENGKFGYANANAEVTTPCIYDEAKPYSNGIGFVRLGDIFYALDVDGNVLFNTKSGLKADLSLSDNNTITIYGRDKADLINNALSELDAQKAIFNCLIKNAKEELGKIKNPKTI